MQRGSWSSVPAIALALAALLLPACGPLPKDPERTTEGASRGPIRVGVTENPPWIVRNGEEAGGVEGALIREFARTVGTEVEWVWGVSDDHYRGLERFELQLVAGGLTDDTPWKDRVGMTRPFLETGREKHVMFVPPGENRWLVRFETFLMDRKAEASRLLRTEAAR
jgi:hypothetical protein